MRTYNAVILGAGGVGKSSLTLRFMKDKFVEGYDPTIEESYRKSVKVDNETCLLEVLDTAGAEQFTSMNEYYIKGSAGFILVFSLTQASSMREVDALRQLIFRIKGRPPPPSFSLEPNMPSSPNANFGASSVRLRPPSSDGHGATSHSMLNQDSSSTFDNTRPSTPAKGSFVPGTARRHNSNIGRAKMNNNINRPGSSNGDQTRNWGRKPGSNRTSDEGEAAAAPMAFDPNDKYHHIPLTRDTSSIPLVIVGTKSDLVGEREVSREMAIRMATLWGVPYYETSARLNHNVGGVFEDIIRQMRDQYPTGSRLNRKKSLRPGTGGSRGDGGKCTIQ